ncbi:MAG: DUF1801 domain-containing protein [Rhodoglobus sp.]
MATNTAGGNFTADERAAMKERAKEAKSTANKAEALKEVLDKIAAMSPSDRKLAERIHAVVLEAAPELAPKTWYGMPAYAKNDKIVCFFQDAGKFKARYATLGFSDEAKLDDGNFWPNSYAIQTLTAADEKSIAALVKRAVG